MRMNRNDTLAVVTVNGCDQLVVENAGTTSHRLSPPPLALAYDHMNHLLIADITSTGDEWTFRFVPAFQCHGKLLDYYHRCGSLKPGRHCVPQEPFEMSEVGGWLVVVDITSSDNPVFFVHVPEPTFMVEVFYKDGRWAGFYSPSNVSREWLTRTYAAFHEFWHAGRQQ